MWKAGLGGAWCEAAISVPAGQPYWHSLSCTLLTTRLDAGEEEEDEEAPSRKRKAPAGKSGRASAAKATPSTRPSSAAAAKAGAEAPASAGQREGAPTGGSGRSGRRKVVGRPVTAPADPNDPELTEQERRKIKRCGGREGMGWVRLGGEGGRMDNEDACDNPTTTASHALRW